MGGERHLPLARWADGTHVRREDIQHLLGLAALSQGVDAPRIGSHSLRIGGATALYHVVNDLQVVRRYGRRASDTFHAYLWESHEAMEGLASKMAADRSEIVAPHVPAER